MQSPTIDEFELEISAYLEAKKRDSDRPPHFDRAFVDIDTNEPIDEHSCAQAVEAIGKQCRRLYAIVKYGSPKKRLTGREKNESKPIITRLSSHRIRFDFSKMLRRLWEIADSWSAPQKQHTLFEPLAQLLQARTTKLDEEGTRQLLLRIVTVAGISWTFISTIPVIKDFGIKWIKERNRHEYALLELNRLNALTHPTSRQNAKVDGADLETQTKILQLASNFSELARNDPIVTFVGAETEATSLPLFKVIESSGGGRINGIEFTKAGAAFVAKRAKQKPRKDIGKWSTKVTLAS